MGRGEQDPGTAETDPAAPVLRIRLLGGFRVERADGDAWLPAPWPRTSARDLVKLLAVAPAQRLHREQVMAACWPDTAPEAALRSLRVALHAARRTLEPTLTPRATSSYVSSAGTMIGLVPGTVVVDTDEALDAAARAQAIGTVDALGAALARFTGELLPEDAYAEWAQYPRAHLADVHEQLRIAHAEALIVDGALDEALEAGHRIIDVSAADERAHRVVMAAYLDKGLRRQALRQYHRCRENLAEELGVRPDLATEALHRRALAGAPVPGGAPSHRHVPAALRGRATGPRVAGADLVAELLRPGGPPVAVVLGEAGLGKTRLVSDAARQALADGWTVLWGAGHEAEGGTPYGVVAEALDAWLADASVERRAAVAAEHPELAAVLPSLGLADAGTSRSPESERYRLFTAVAGLIGAIESSGAVLLVLEDVHAGDVGSLQTVAHLARWIVDQGRRVRIALTSRGGEAAGEDPRHAVLSGLARAGLSRDLGLALLDRQGCDALVTSMRGPGISEADDRALQDRVWELSGGNPLFAVELVRESAGRGARALELADGPSADGVRRLVGARLGLLDPPTHRVVEIVAVAGDGVALADVAEVAAEGLHPPLSPARTALAMDAAVAASVLVERDVVVDGRAQPGLAFRHPLVRVACYDELTNARRRVLHAVYSESLLRRRPDALDTLAGHLSRAEDPRAVRYLRLAAERAAALGANDTADRYYVELTGRLDRAAAEASVARVDRSVVLQRMGRYPEAARILREAVEDLARRDDEDALLTAVGRLGEALARARESSAALEVLEAYPLTAGVGARTRAVHHAARSLTYLVLGRYSDGVAAATEAREAAELVQGRDRRGLLARASSLGASGVAVVGTLHEARAAADAALPHAEAYGEPQLLTTVLSVVRENARRAGRIDEALAVGARALELAERAGNASERGFELANLAELHLLHGDVDDASAAVDRAAEQGDPQSWSGPYVHLARARLRARTGTGGLAAALDEARAAARALGDRQAFDEALVIEVEDLLGRRGAAGAGLAAALLDQVVAARVEHLRAWAALVAGSPGRAAERGARERARAAGAGERLLEAVAGGVLAVALADLGRRGESVTALAEARRIASETRCTELLRPVEVLAAARGM